MSDLHARAEAAGLSREWQDAKGQAQCVSDEALAAILDRLDTDHGEPVFVSSELDQAIALPGTWRDGPAQLTLDNGEVRSVVLNDGILPAIADWGHHRLEQGGRSITVAVAPARCPAPPPGRHWGSAVQIPSLREGGGAYGDFASLAMAARTLGQSGASALAISPVHALFPADASRFSPYAPSSRLFRNIWLAPAGDPVNDSPPLIDWATAAPDRLRDLRLAYDRLDDKSRSDVARWRHEQGERLEAQVRFDALQAHFYARDRAQGWRDWPSEYHDPTGAAVTHFVAEHEDAIAFYAFAQWWADCALAQASTAARKAGMGIGLIADLAIGVAADGADSWSRPGELLSGLSIGAPPDPLGPEGQNWGITALSPFALRRLGFAPFIQTLRAVFAHAGGIRIDHALGLCRLWVIPEGAPADQGAYLAMPFADLLRILRIEAQRANDGRGAIVIGEDLGTVPPGFRDTMAGVGMLGMRVLPFERDAEGRFTRPEQWDAQAIAMTATHDIPTVRGWWTGRDLDWRARIAGRSLSSEDSEHRAQEKAALWAMIGEDTAPPSEPEPVVDAAIKAVAATPCPLAIVPLEDLLGLEEQPNLPGTIDEHPNWRRRLPETLDAACRSEAVAARIAMLNAR
ncbi:4-alpha-glucanotransferase [Sphingomonas sanguinis]|uniref:4-alpha-glucanotransferase n=1 Tax=Sphingomonas sanguinis TaxID=33051 RepID=A0A7Y7QUD6_9SPHN|nr:4-alpha-glucanotransferase [Sphingomonas sanguinis]MBZ6381545.1 4-alpha-glucanotransferase [Sphingomonas sanguinis]NNG51186.1 4-alpha-glucanotransferase [Sphingomonas sanguinis]NNG52868.1 4-alpha-glucanotransferase [Sphingomonas sanguinis]NVP30847.1 4-alpha-glucanotransferase [Sphingomonas sanguinis]